MSAVRSVVGHENLNATVHSNDIVQMLTLSVSQDKFKELQHGLNRMLNTWDAAPRWLFDLSDVMSDMPSVDVKGMRQVKPK